MLCFTTPLTIASIGHFTHRVYNLIYVYHHYLPIISRFPIPNSTYIQPTCLNVGRTEIRLLKYRLEYIKY